MGMKYNFNRRKPRRKKKEKDAEYDPENRDSKYGKSVYFNKVVLIIGFIIIMLFNLALPPFSDGSIGLFSLFQWGNTFILFLGMQWILAPDIEANLIIVSVALAVWFTLCIVVHLVLPISKPQWIYDLVIAIINFGGICLYMVIDNRVYVKSIPIDEIDK